MNLAALRSPRVVVALLLLVLIAMTAPRVFTAPLWGDELRTWRDGIARPLADVLAWQHNPDHAPLGHLLARGGAAVFGVDRPWALRLGAWLCGLACVPALWRLGRAIHSDAAGLLMALMFVVDPTQVFQITQARMYPPMILAGIVALTVAARLLDRPLPSLDSRHFVVTFGPRDWLAALGLAVAIGVGIWSHAQIYAVVLAVLIASIARLAWPRSSDPTRDLGGSRLGAALAIVALLAGLGIGWPGVAKLIGNRDRAQVVDANVTLERPAEQLEDASIALTGHNVLTVVVVGSAIVGLAFLARRRPATAVLLGATVAFAAVNLLVAARYRPIAHARYLAIAQPPLWGAIAIALIELARLRPRRAWVESDDHAPREARTFVANGWDAGAGADIRPDRGRRGRPGAIAVVLFAAFAGLCGYQLWRTIESLPAHPLAAPFREACRYVLAHRSAGSRVVILPGSPLQTYARYYGLEYDVGLDDAVTKMPRGERRRPTSRPALAADAELWLIGITPTTERWRGTGDDPLVANEIISRARRQYATTLPTTTDLGRREVIVVRFPPGAAGERVAALRGRAWSDAGGEAE